MDFGVQPPLLERELIDMFMNTLQGPYLDKMVRRASSGFSGLVISGERIESCLKTDKIKDTTVVAKGAKKPHSGSPKTKTGEGTSLSWQMFNLSFKHPWIPSNTTCMLL